MATIKLTIDRKRTYSDGRVPVIFRLTHKTKSTRIESGIKIHSDEWDSIRSKLNKIHPKAKEFNLILSKKLVELEKSLLEADQDLSIRELKEALLNKNRVKIITFYEFACQEIQNLKNQERFGNAQSYETAVNRFVRFTGKDITLERINYSLISDFDNQLLKEGLSRNSVAVYMRELRALLNKAIHKGLLDKNRYPFSYYKIKTVKTVSRAILKDDLQKIKHLNLQEDTELWNSRNIFFLIFNLIGISFIDLALLTPSSIQGTRIVYRRRKTGKIYSIKLTVGAKRILESYKSDRSNYLIPLGLDGIPKHKEREVIALRLRTYNKYLMRIGKLCDLPVKLTTYVARYSWANIAKSLGYPKDQIAEALGHEYGNRVTGIYLDNYGSEVIDEMNERVTSRI
jgi:site-specific recombinase XerD